MGTKTVSLTRDIVGYLLKLNALPKDAMMVGETKRIPMGWGTYFGPDPLNGIQFTFESAEWDGAGGEVLVG